MTLFENLFKREIKKTKYAHNEFLRDISLPTLSQETPCILNLRQKYFVKTNLWETMVYQKKFMKSFSEELKQPFTNLLNQSNVGKNRSHIKSKQHHSY